MSPLASVSYFGLPGSYSHEVVRRRFGARRPPPQMVSRRTVAEVFGALRRGESCCGVVPIENSLGGPIPETVDELVREDFLGSGLRVCEQLGLRVRLSLLGHKGREPRKIFSHFAPLKNVGGWLRQRYRRAQIIEVESTAAAAALAARQKNAAAVASSNAASIYHLDVLNRSLPSIGENITQFFVIGRQPEPLSRNSRTVVVFGLKHESGSLVKALGALARHHRNLTRIVSRAKPQGPGEYVFLVEFEGRLADRPTQRACAELRRRTEFLRVLGSFPVRKEFV